MSSFSGIMGRSVEPLDGLLSVSQGLCEGDAEGGRSAPACLSVLRLMCVWTEKCRDPSELMSCVGTLQHPWQASMFRACLLTDLDSSPSDRCTSGPSSPPPDLQMSWRAVCQMCVA